MVRTPLKGNFRPGRHRETMRGLPGRLDRGSCPCPHEFVVVVRTRGSGRRPSAPPWLGLPDARLPGACPLYSSTYSSTLLLQMLMQRWTRLLRSQRRRTVVLSLHLAWSLALGNHRRRFPGAASAVLFSRSRLCSGTAYATPLVGPAGCPPCGHAICLAAAEGRVAGKQLLGVWRLLASMVGRARSMLGAARQP